MPPRILIADDHDIVREGVRTLIARARPNWQICGEARNGNEAISAVQRLKPDVIVLDITMPGLSGLEATERIVRLDTGCRIVIFTMHESSSLDGEVRRTGAHGFVLKSEASRNLITAIETVLSGGTFYGLPAFPTKKEDEKPEPGIAFWPVVEFVGT
jgi:DNA-binding NarL/FixJ family response regulator